MIFREFLRVFVRACKIDSLFARLWRSCAFGHSINNSFAHSMPSFSSLIPVSVLSCARSTCLVRKRRTQKNRDRVPHIELRSSGRYKCKCVVRIVLTKIFSAISIWEASSYVFASTSASFSKGDSLYLSSLDAKNTTRHARLACIHMFASNTSQRLNTNTACVVIHGKVSMYDTSMNRDTCDMYFGARSITSLYR